MGSRLRAGWVGLALIGSLGPTTPTPLLVDAARSTSRSELAATPHDASEHGATTGATGLHSINRVHGLAAIFDAAGARIHDPVARGSREAIASLRLVGFGREGFFSQAIAGRVESVGSRVEIRRPGIVEWYENGPEGLEQGFSIASRPLGGSPLAIELDVLPAKARLTGSSVLLSTPSGRTLAYRKLEVADATGARVPAHFEVADPTRIRLVIDDRNVEYPIEIDPILSGMRDTSLFSDQPSSLYGYSVASAGDVNGDGYDDVLVGAYDYDDSGSPAGSGSAFLYLGSAFGVVTDPEGPSPARLHGTSLFQYFGVSVAGAGDVNGDGFDDVIVGSNYSDGEVDEGAAFVFLGGPTGIASASADEAHAVLEGGQAGSGFGYSVASAGDVNGDGRADVIVGAPSYDGLVDGNLVADGGAAFVFLGSATGIASAEASAAATRLLGGTSQDLFGFSVASAGDVNGDDRADVIVGARHFSSGQPDEGGAFIYHGSATGVLDGTTNSAAAVLQSDDPDGQLFDVASAGDLNDDGFDDVVVGIPLRASTDEGAVFVYPGGPNGIGSGGAASAIQIVSDQYFANFGTRAASAGDVNGDGYGDLVVGAARYDAGETDEGAVFVYLGGPNGIGSGFSSIAFRRLEVDDPGALLGTSVASAGDVDGDGLSDVIAGAPYYGTNDAGAAFLWTGEDDGQDRDGDGLTNAEERLHSTDLRNPDTDGDGLNDGVEVAEGSDPRSPLDPPSVGTPFTASSVGLSSVTTRRRFRVDLSQLPTRPVLIVEVTADPLHPDMRIEIEAIDWQIQDDYNPGGTNCPRPETVLSTPNPIERESGSARLEIPLLNCDPFLGGFTDGSVTVRVRATELGAAGAPASVAVAIRGITQPATESTGSIVSHQLTPRTIAFEATKDTVLYEDSPSASNGQGDFLWLFSPSAGVPGRRHSLIAFDLESRIPPGSVVDSARFRFNLGAYFGGPRLRIHRMMPSPSGTWDEGNAIAPDVGFNGGSSSIPAADWLHRSSAGAPWSIPGGDLVSEPVFEQEVSGGTYFFDSTPELALAVTDMIAEGRASDGFVLTSAPDPGGDTRIVITSREGADPYFPGPSLEVTFTPSQPMVSGTVKTGVLPFISEGQDFRWIYDVDHDDIFETSIGGICEVTDGSLRNDLPYTYRFQGTPGFTGVDCCTWRIESQTGVVGTGQALFYHNVDPSNPANRPPDTDRDGILNLCDNCPSAPNGPFLGTCVVGSVGASCRSNQECGVGGRCNLSQEDWDLDQVGDACPEPGLGAGLMAGLSAIAAWSHSRRRRTSKWESSSRPAAW